MEYDGDILRFAWPYVAGTGRALVLTDDSMVVIRRAGEDDSVNGMYRSADVETHGVRRRGDVLFGVRQGGGALPLSLQNVVLHVVSQPSPSYYDADGVPVPQMVLNLPRELRESVASLKRGAGSYECGIWLGDIATARRISLLDRLMVERLGRKCADVMNVFESCGGDWAQTLYVMLFRAMGGNRNREPYMRLASLATYQMAMRERGSVEMVEALLLGTSGLLDGCYFDDYVKRLNDDYIYLARKYNITPMRSGEWALGGIRAQNRPLTRIVQLASFVAGREFMFDSVIECRSRADVHAIFDVEVSEYWATHRVPDGTGERCPKRIGTEKSDLLAINAVVPVMFAYGQYTGKEALKEAAFELLECIPPESNSIIRNWSGMGVPVKSALDSQALIQLKNEYCAAGRCTDCCIGKHIIKIGV